MLRFMPPPPPPSYEFEADTIVGKHHIRLKGANEMVHCHRFPDKFDAFYTQTSRGSQIACVMIKSCKNPKFTILYNHGGTIDMGKAVNYYYTLGDRLNCNIFTYDYTDFGVSSGSNGNPSEKKFYADSEAAFNIMIEKYGLMPEKIILYGQSIGGAVATHLALLHNNVAGLVLHSAFMSLFRIVFPKMGTTIPFDVFANIDKIGKITVPILIIHGTSDKETPIIHGRELYNRCQKPLPPFWVTGGDHHNIYTRPEYYDRLKRFVNTELIVVNNNDKTDTKTDDTDKSDNNNK